jgi:hypothetical protein
MFTKRNRAGALSAVVVALVLALTAAACGSDDDDNGGGGSGDGGNAAASQGGSDGSSSPASGDEAEIRAVYAKFTDSVFEQNARAACATMTPTAQKRFAGEGTCAEGLANLFGERRPGAAKPKIRALKVDGDRAIANARSEDAKQTSVIQFVKRGNEWLIAGERQ